MLENQEVEEEEIELTDDDIFELNLELNQQRNEKSTMDVNNLIERVRDENNEAIKKLNGEIQELKAMVAQLLKKWAQCVIFM